MDLIHQHVLSPLNKSPVQYWPMNDVSVILDKFQKRQTIQNQVTPKIHQHGVSSCVSYQYDLIGGVTIK